METISLTFDNLQQEMYGFVQDVVDTYKQLLIKDGKDPRGNLIQSLEPVAIDFTNGDYEGSISIAEYWKYVEYGRRPGKFPPPNAMLSWVKARKIIPRANKGLKPPTEKQMAFLVGRKISREGIKKGTQMEQAVDICWSRWEERIDNAITADLETALS